MICPSCGYDNIEGADRCDDCMTPLFNRDVPHADSAAGMARSSMEEDLRKLENEFLAVTPDTSASDVVNQMKQARLGCALVLDDGKLVGIVSALDMLRAFCHFSDGAEKAAQRP